jgi:hypothetical protein
MADINPEPFIDSFLSAGTPATAKTAIDMGAVDNTSDANKPISDPTKVVTDAITARQWVEVLSDTVAENAIDTAWADNVVSVMSISGGGWPEDFGVVVVDRRSGRTSREFNSTTGKRYTSTYSGIWSEWEKPVTTEEGEILEQIEMPNQLATNPESAMTRQLVEDLLTAESLEIITVSGNVDLTIRNHYCDPTAGDITYTLPESQDAENLGKIVTIKRIENGGNVVTVDHEIGDTINMFTESVILANINEYISMQAVPSYGWQTLNRFLTAYASMGISTPTTFSATTGFTKFTSWDANNFTTLQKFEADQANSRFNVVHHTGAPFDAYAVNVIVTFEGTNNVFVEAQLYDGSGNPLSQLVAVNGLGAGKPVTIAVTTEILIAAIGSIEVRVLSESAQTLTISAGSMSANRING